MNFCSALRHFAFLLLMAFFALFGSVVRAAEPTIAVGDRYSDEYGPSASTSVSSGGAGLLPAPSPAQSGALMRPFSRIAFSANVGVLGVGMELATPFTPHSNLRASGSFFPYQIKSTDRGFFYDAQANLASARLMWDWYAGHSGFRVSPGMMVSNGNQARVALEATPGQTISLGDGTYVSSSSDPIGGNAALTFRSCACHAWLSV